VVRARASEGATRRRREQEVQRAGTCLELRDSLRRRPGLESRRGIGRADSEVHGVRGGLAPRRSGALARFGCDEDLDEPGELYFYCPECAEREFS
jgi:hypothetical protein